MIKSLVALVCLLALTACASPGPTKPGPPRYSFTEVSLVDVDRRIAAVKKLEEPLQLMNREQAELAFAAMPRSEKLMKAYEEVSAQKPDQIWIGLVSYTCLPPLQVMPRYSGNELYFSVLIDPQNEVVDCVRVAPLVGVVGVTDNK